MAKKEPENDFEPGTPINRPDIIEEHRQAVESTARQLAAQPKVRVRIALPPGITPTEAAKMEKPPCVPVCVNGYVYQIRRGDSVEVPKTVADILEEAGLI